jgi:hypothetical protein
MAEKSFAPAIANANGRHANKRLAPRRQDVEHNDCRRTHRAFPPSFGVVIMFKSQTARTSLLPHLATAAALLFTVALGVVQSSAQSNAAVDNTASVTAR